MEPLKTKVWKPPGYQVSDKVHGIVYYKVYSQVNYPCLHQVWHQVRSEVCIQVDKEIKLFRDD